MKELDITESKARKLVKKFCNDFCISQCRVWFIHIDDPTTLGWYEHESDNMFAYMMIEKKWSRRLVLVLHELTHHLQREVYSQIDSPHGNSFTLARSRLHTWAKKNVSDHFDWESLIKATTIGRMKWKKKKKKKKK